MHCTCVRHTELPHTSALFADVLYHPDRTRTFYRHPLRDAEAYQAAAGEIQFSDAQRAALVAALRETNPDSPALQRLSQPGTLVVATGQQVGLFSGPGYTVYKALHAAKLADWLTAHGIPAVPVFWLATEDHDFAEVNHVWVFDSAHQPRKLEMRRSAGAQPAGEVTLVAPPVDELRQALNGWPYGDEVSAMVEAAYQPGVTMGKAFGDLLRRILPGFDILQLDPMRESFRQLAAPALRSAVENADDLTEAVLARNRELSAAGYHAQVHVEPQTSLVFLLENGKRNTLRRNGREYGLNGRRFSTEELAESARWLSPNALLRPVVQDSMLPTVATIAGPAELAYFAQSEVIYQRILGRMPVAVPRSGFTVLDERSQKRIEKYRLSLSDFFAGEEALRQRIASALVPPDLSGVLRQTTDSVNTALDRLRAAMTSFDPTLAKAVELSARKVRHQVSKVEGKAGREAMRRDERAARDARSLFGLIYPERHLQERLHSFLPLLAKHGAELVDQVYQAIELGCADHRILVV
ncbi:MAG TPA: bacillithiol biosynthesis cysteine-adding enzyme BshC [Verrucomicrobiae bacterium]|nr:bacillithiol biosynthesis cysteine-adding enzyme BshC [Verrucomicrobiae bacterium]